MTENVKHVEALAWVSRQMQLASAVIKRSMEEGRMTDHFAAHEALKHLTTVHASLQREAAGDGEVVAEVYLHEYYETRPGMTGEKTRLAVRLLNTSIQPGTKLYTAPRPTGTEAACTGCDGTGELHRPDGEYAGPCPFHTTPASAEPGEVSDFARGLAEQDAKLTGTGFLVDGGYVSPDRVQVITSRPDARGGGEAVWTYPDRNALIREVCDGLRGYRFDVDPVCVMAVINSIPAQTFSSMGPLSRPTPAELDAERLDWMLDKCAVIKTDGKQWRVEYEWLPEGTEGPWANSKRAAIDAAITDAARATTGSQS